ncbi:translation initiation factor IF-2-like isoform X1 [Canis lupus familiaris]|uniref:translation initiation factor IF-2-like isoform X1 n=1 Tax=Canis lupus familiaris TaxID=9615 RepID=UPI0018F44012|nr:translation initiation factor IF-2-like isoform X1 [Canis lupus familiaris]XP_038427559.1 translation initiation factor IF-2-like isoform X1 [Canis lupus familiaris]
MGDARGRAPGLLMDRLISRLDGPEPGLAGALWPLHPGCGARVPRADPALPRPPPRAAPPRVPLPPLSVPAPAPRPGLEGRGSAPGTARTALSPPSPAGGRGDRAPKDPSRDRQPHPGPPEGRSSPRPGNSGGPLCQGNCALRRLHRALGGTSLSTLSPHLVHSSGRRGRGPEAREARLRGEEDG